MHAKYAFRKWKKLQFKISHFIENIEISVAENLDTEKKKICVLTF